LRKNEINIYTDNNWAIQLIFNVYYICHRNCNAKFSQNGWVHADSLLIYQCFFCHMQIPDYIKLFIGLKGSLK